MVEPSGELRILVAIVASTLMFESNAAATGSALQWTPIPERPSTAGLMSVGMGGLRVLLNVPMVLLISHLIFKFGAKFKLPIFFYHVT